MFSKQWEALSSSVLPVPRPVVARSKLLICSHDQGVFASISGCFLIWVVPGRLDTYQTRMRPEIFY